MDGWKTSFLWGWPIFQVNTLVSGRVCPKKGITSTFLFFSEPSILFGREGSGFLGQDISHENQSSSHTEREDLLHEPP